MSLSSGSRLGLYEILAPLGAGGMGEVYRARDTRLRREIAIKVLPDTFASDAQRLGRFEREAQLLASLSHPNIAAIHGFEEADGTHFLVLELVAGQTLAERLTEGPLELEEAFNVGRQIAEGLEAAHERGVIHRDLKPSNVKITPEGKVKVLDFGLAKALGAESSAPDLSRSPTVAPQVTSAGIILGTAAYMSPEQARGKPLDKRTDVWSFGCVLYETLTGRQAFSGETVSDTLVAILGREPDWQALPAGTPAKIRDLLRRCLQKDPARRLRDIGDARIEIEEARAEPAATTIAPIGAEQPRRSSRMLPWVGTVLATIIAAAVLWIRRPASTPTPAVKRFTLSVPMTQPRGILATLSPPTIVLSPDGSRLVYVARRGGETELRLREMNRLGDTSIPGTEGGVAPFFSPEGRRIGFFSRFKLKTVDLASGDVTTLCDARWAWGGSWTEDESILFVPGSAAGIWRVPSRGGEPQVVVAPDFAKGERSYRFPEILPGGRAVIYTLIRTRSGTAAPDTSVAVLEPSTGRRRVLVEAGSNAHFAATGHLVYARTGALLAVPFDLAKLEVTGPSKPAGEDVLTDPGSAAAQFSLAGEGTLVYVPGSVQTAVGNVLWVDRKGVSEPVTDAARSYGYPSVSPDGRRMAFSIAESGNTDIWVEDLDRGSLTRLTSDAAIELRPTWTPDGDRVTFGSNRAGWMDLHWTKSDGSEPEKALLTAPLAQQPTSWSPDGRHLAYTEEDPKTGFDLWVLALDGRRTAFLRTPFDERGATFSRDGRWLAYTSNESGRDEIYVRPFPGPGPKWQISTGGGSEPVWARSGGELFYRSVDKMMAVAISTTPTFQPEKPMVLFEGEYERPDALTSYDVAPDGRFAMVRGETQSALSPLHVVLNWFEELKRRVPADKN
jgi:serine/threonine-protein kinase